MFQKIAKHRANDASNDVHRPPLPMTRQQCLQSSNIFHAIHSIPYTRTWSKPGTLELRFFQTNFQLVVPGDRVSPKVALLSPLSTDLRSHFQISSGPYDKATVCSIIKQIPYIRALSKPGPWSFASSKQISNLPLMKQCGWPRKNSHSNPLVQ